MSEGTCRSHTDPVGNLSYFAYANTAQETCLRLMGRKLLVSLAMEGKFSTEGLQSVGDDDLLMAMAREQVTEQRIGESAEETWRSIQRQNAAFWTAAAVPLHPRDEPEASPDVILPVTLTIDNPSVYKLGSLADLEGVPILVEG